jgi:hypothetical protein
MKGKKISDNAEKIKYKEDKTTFFLIIWMILGVFP